MTLHEEALAALDAKASSERQLAAAVNCPPWRHAAFALLMAALVAAPAVPMPMRWAVLAGVMAAIVLIVRSDRKRLGMFVNGYRRGKTRIVAFAMLAVDLGLYAGSIWAVESGHALLPLLLAVVAFGFSYAGSVVWQRVFVRELTA